MVAQVDRQLFAHWRASLRAPRRSQAAGSRPLRIAVVGNCQSFGYAYGMKLFAPEAQIDRYALVGRTLADSKLLFNALKSYDLVFAQDFGPKLLRDDATSDDLRAELPHARFLPYISFFGFHPDTIYILGPVRAHELIYGPMGVYNSALVLYGYLRGLSVVQTQALFSTPVFEHVGYLEVWEDAARELLEGSAARGLDLTYELARWSRQGKFMYTPNHPKNFVMVDLARRALREADVPTRDVDPSDYAVDDLARSAILPLYPPLAEKYGLRGSDLFKQENYKLSQGVGEFFRLEGFIARSYAAFAKFPREKLRHPRVEQWRANSQTARILDELSAQETARAK